MPDDRDERIRRRAHEIWEREGRPHGKDAEHWERAAREIDGEAAAAAQPGNAFPGKARTRAGGGRKPAAAVPGAAPAEAAPRTRSGKPAGGTKRPGG